MTPETIFMLLMVTTANPDVSAVVGLYDSALKCFGASEAVKRNAISINPDLDLVCKQLGLPEVEPEPAE
jgi:hypothetical protein